jgi:HAD superfamily hydrolase (TIGR01509 family)
MATIKSVIFDMDGLMLDTEKIYYKASQETADTIGMDYSFDVYAQFIGAGDAQMETAMREMYTDHELLETFFTDSQEELEYLLLNGPVDLKEGLIELLEYLQAAEIPAVVASSTRREMVDQLLDRLDLQKYFKDIVGGDEVTAAKPDPAIFDLAFTKTELENKEDALILEDSKNGIRAAHSAGVPVILVPDMLEADDEMEEKTAAIVPNLHHVIDYIEKN